MFLIKKEEKRNTVLYFMSLTLFIHENIVAFIRILWLNLMIRLSNEIKHVSSLIFDCFS